MATQTREQGRFLGGRPPYGYQLADAGPHPNKAHAAWGRRAHRLEPDPATAHVVGGCSPSASRGTPSARITRALNDAGIPCPSAADPERNPHRSGAAWTLARSRRSWPTRATPAGRCGTGSAPTPTWPTRPTSGLGHKQVQRWNLPAGWVISARPAHPALVSEADYIAAQNVSAARGPAPRRPAAPDSGSICWPGCWHCGNCGRRMESAWSNGKAAYRCRHGHTSAARPSPGRPRNPYVREDRILPHLPALTSCSQAPSPAAREGAGPAAGSTRPPRPAPRT